MLATFCESVDRATLAGVNCDHNERYGDYTFKRPSSGKVDAPVFGYALGLGVFEITRAMSSSTMVDTPR